MITDERLSQAVEQWLLSEARPLPAHVLDGAMSDVARTDQHRWRRRWWVPLERGFAVAGVAALIVVASLVIPDLLHWSGSGLSTDRGSARLPVPTTDALVGEWQAVDVDGSQMTLTIEPGSDGELKVSLIDPYSQGCDRLSAGITEYRGTAIGVHRGDALHVVWIEELCGDLRLSSPPFVMTYDPDLDRLDGMEVTWTR